MIHQHQKGGVSSCVTEDGEERDEHQCIRRASLLREARAALTEMRLAGACLFSIL